MNENFTWLLHFKGKQIKSQSTPLYLNSPSTFESLISWISNSNICTGNNDDKFITISHEKGGKFMDSKGELNTVGINA